MLIRMIKTENGSVDGVRVQPYVEGEEYDLSATDGHISLARAFIEAGFAEEVDGSRKTDGAPEGGDAQASDEKQGRKRK